jgi:hypothetical protein
MVRKLLCMSFIIFASAFHSFVGLFAKNANTLPLCTVIVDR